MTSTTKRDRPALLAGGAIAAVAAVLAIVAGGLALGVNSERDASGYLTSGTEHYSTPGHALETKSYRAGGLDDIAIPARVVGNVHVAVQSPKPVFVGIGPSSDVQRYLRGVARKEVTGLDAKDQKTRSGNVAPATPATQRFWVSSATGSSQPQLSWKARQGSWRLVVMNADGTPGVSAGVSMGAKLPRVGTYGGIALAVGLLLAGVAVFLVRAGQPSARPGPHGSTVETLHSPVTP